MGRTHHPLNGRCCRVNPTAGFTPRLQSLPRDTAKKGGSGVAEAASWPRKDSQVGGFQQLFTLGFLFIYVYSYIIYIYLFIYFLIYLCV